MTPPFKKPNPSHRMPTSGRFGAVVIGVSAGGLEALNTLLPMLPVHYPMPILIVQHRPPGNDDYLTQYLNRNAAITVKEAEEKERLRDGYAYIAPADYHLLVEQDETLSLSVGPKENFSRPAINVLFESAAYVWSDRLIGIILTGANADGAKGLALIKQRGGTVIVQDPLTAEQDTMPLAAIAACQVDYILNLQEMGILLLKLSQTATKTPI